MPAASSSKRPRFWVPGILWVNEERELVVGPQAGFNGYGDGFRAARCAHFTSLRDLRHRIWLVTRKSLTPEIIDEHAIILPETILDPDRLPNARRWLAEQPLVCVSGTKVDRLVDAGLRIYVVEHGVEGDDEMAVTALGGKRAEWTFRGRIPDLVPAELRDEVSQADVASRSTKREVRELVDRVLDALTRGVLREASVVNAYAARALVEPGYGYYGAPDGTAAPVGRVQREVRGLEALFAQIYDRAGDMVEDAKAIAAAVNGAGIRSTRVELPVYGGAHRAVLEALEIPLATDEDEEGPRWVVSGLRDGGQERRAMLELPMELRWVVDRVKMWAPRLPAELERELNQPLAVRRPPPAWLAMSLVGVLVAIIVLGLVLGEPLP